MPAAKGIPQTRGLPDNPEQRYDKPRDAALKYFPVVPKSKISQRIQSFVNICKNKDRGNRCTKVLLMRQNK